MGLRRLLSLFPVQDVAVKTYSHLRVLRRKEVSLSLRNVASSKQVWGRPKLKKSVTSPVSSVACLHTIPALTHFTALHTDAGSSTDRESEYGGGGKKEGEEEDNDHDVPFLREICAIPDAGHHVLVIQPAVTWGPRKKVKTTPDLQLTETCALVSTIPRWKVVQQRIVPVRHPGSSQMFGSGTFQQLKRQLNEQREISAVVVGVDLLSSDQLAELHRSWKVPVFDRYTIVLQIFKAHARTKEAKLQVALAEVPYVRSRLNQIHQGHHDHQVGGDKFVGGTGETYISQRRHILQEKETKLRKALQKLKTQRSLLRQNRQRHQLPTIAVVGYTNAGKTTIIKALTGDADLEPKDQLFATLDVTAHAGKLPNLMNVVFVDTVGFISDIPVSLIDAFAATLEDAVLADVVVHVRDISHPNTLAQKQNVLETLSRMLSSQQVHSMIEVCNKADLKLDRETVDVDSGAVWVSAVTGEGVGQLRSRLQTAVISASGQLEKRFRIPMQGPMLAWLYKEATVRSAQPCPKNSEHLLVDVVISSAAYHRFQTLFTKLKTTRP